MSFIEQLPYEILGKDGQPNYLRIKARGNGKKWCIRYIRKVTRADKPIRGLKYRTELQAWNMNLEHCAKRMQQALLLHNYGGFKHHK